MTSSLPTDVDSSYPDRSPGDAAHQQHHDVLHALNNVFDGAAEGQTFEKQGGELVAVSGASVGWRDAILPWETPAASVGTWSVTVDGTRPFAGRLESDGTQNAEVDFNVVLGAGTWTMELLHYASTNRGIYTVTFDGAAPSTFGGSADTIDGYSASPAVTRTTITGLVIPAHVKRVLKLKMATKNASSPGYLGSISGVLFRRTA